jgi:hypothetical protein
LKTAALALLALLAPLGLHAEPKLTGGSDTIPRNLVASGGGLSSGGGFILDSSIGENGISTASGAGYAAAPGLMSLIAQPGSVTSITAVTKDTGTLTLSWVSPGLDGFSGDVASGFYRVDASSDPLHVFDPTIFTAQFATVAAAGSTQTYAVAGLLPNTTYYSRIYLADARKVVSETSATSAQSSLARAPAAPAITGVFITSVTISWTLPAGGAEGFSLAASTSAFLGGSVVSSQTPSGASATLTITGLLGGTTYFFNLASLNWQGQGNVSTVLTTTTVQGLAPIENLAVAGNALGRSLTLTWINPVYANSGGVTILVSSSPISASLANGTAYPPGASFPDGSIVKSTAPASSYVQASLTLDVTSYFSLYSRDSTNSYSVAVSTALVLNLQPMAPAGLQGSLSPGATAFLLSWAGVASRLDGTAFAKTGSPTTWELDHYDIYRATGIVNASWVWISSVPASTAAYSAAVPAPGSVYYYEVVSRDLFPGSVPDSAMAVDTFGDLWVIHPDLVTRLEIPAALARVVTAGGNSYGRPLLVRAHDRPQDLAGPVVTSAQFAPVVSPGNQPAVLPNDGAGYAIALHYPASGGYIVPNLSGVSAATPNTPGNLSAFYVNGSNAAQVFGRVDTVAQEVQVQSGLVGDYQVRTVLRNQAFNFDISGISNRAITPNGDGLNDTVVFTFDNPHDSAFSGRIFDVRGRYVSDMAPGPVAGASLMWDAKSGGRVVPRGVYIYQIQAEGKTFNGTVVVIR